jgi:hypothetical protein
LQIHIRKVEKVKRDRLGQSDRRPIGENHDTDLLARDHVNSRGRPEHEGVSWLTEIAEMWPSIQNPPHVTTNNYSCVNLHGGTGKSVANSMGGFLPGDVMLKDAGASPEQIEGAFCFIGSEIGAESVDVQRKLLPTRIALHEGSPQSVPYRRNG